MTLDLEVFQDEMPAPLKLRAKAHEIPAPSTVQKTLHWGCSLVSDLDVLEFLPLSETICTSSVHPTHVKTCILPRF